MGRERPVREDGRGPQERRGDRLRLRGQPDQALQPHQRLAQEPRDRLAQGR